MSAALYFLLLLKGSLFSTSGMGNVPSIHADFLARRWATERQVAEALTIGQIAPGPNGLWVVSFGYLTLGLVGAALALVAICLPPLLVLLLDRAYQKLRDQPAVKGFSRGLSLAVIGIFAEVLVGLLHTAGIDWQTFAILLAAVCLGTVRRIPVIAVIAAAALAGVALAPR